MSDQSINLATLGKLTEDEARKLLEAARWPEGKPICPHCGVVGEAALMESREGTANPMRPGLYHCRPCGQPFTVTVGSVMESSHIPLSKWLMGFHMFASAKKSVSALQLQRQLGLGSYRTAWHMAHRIRHAMANSGPLPPLTGDVEADEMYVGGKPRYFKPKLGRPQVRVTRKIPVAVLVQRDGPARAKKLVSVTSKRLSKFIRDNVDRKASKLFTDEHKGYKTVGETFAGGHETTRHGMKEYAKPGGIHSNTAESFNGLFKRSIMGAWHHISEEHAARYLDEQVFRWSHRKDRDGERTTRALMQAGGVRLMYRKPKASEGDGGDGLVARSSEG